MKKSTLVRLHTYAGLFTSFYLVFFGLSTLILNHRIDVEKKVVTERWESKVEVDKALSSRELAESIRNQMGFMGWVPPWEYERDSTTFQFTVTHLGRNYYLNTDLNSGNLQIAEAPKGLISVLHGMHFFNGKLPNAPFLLRTWQVYQWTTLFVMFISLFLGLWLWIKYSFKPLEVVVFSGVLIVTIVIMILL